MLINFGNFGQRVLCLVLSVLVRIYTLFALKSRNIFSSNNNILSSDNNGFFSTKKGIMATNPCRVQMYTQEIVIFREDIISKMCRNCVYFPEDGDASRHFSRTILSQVCNNQSIINVKCFGY